MTWAKTWAKLCRSAFLLAWVLASDPTTALAEMVLRRGNGAEPGTLDPHRADGAWEIEILNDLFLGLTTLDPAGKPIPGAAEKWNVSPDGLTWRFMLRAGLQWSDGKPLTASDFVFAFRRLLDPKTAARYASLQYVIKNAARVNSGALPAEELGVHAPDDRTVEITLEAPTPFLPGLMGHVTALPIPQHIYRKYGDDWVRAGRMVSDGAYVLDTNSPHDFIKLVKNPRFYDAAQVAIDSVFYYPIDDETVALTRYKAREIDINVTTAGFPIGQLDWLRQNLPGQAHIAPMLATGYLALNIRRAPFDDRRLRRAVSLCIDRETLAYKVGRDERLPAYAFVPPGIANYSNSAKLDFASWPMDRRVAEAKSLLAQAGYNADHPLAVEYMHMNGIDARRAVVAQAAMLKSCGIVLRPIANEAKVHYSAIQEGAFVMASAMWGADYNDPQNFLYLLDSRSLGFNYGGYHNPAFDDLMDRAKVELDIASRARLLASAEQIALDDSAIVPLSFPSSRTLVSPAVTGYRDNPVNAHPTRWMRVER